MICMHLPQKKRRKEDQVNLLSTENETQDVSISQPGFEIKNQNDLITRPPNFRELTTKDSPVALSEMARGVELNPLTGHEYMNL